MADFRILRDGPVLVPWLLRCKRCETVERFASFRETVRGMDTHARWFHIDADWFDALRGQEPAIHMTETRHDARTQRWYVICRCGWSHVSRKNARNDARKHGDEHLKEANSDHHPGRGAVLGEGGGAPIQLPGS